MKNKILVIKQISLAFYINSFFTEVPKNKKNPLRRSRELRSLMRPEQNRQLKFQFQITSSDRAYNRCSVNIFELLNYAGFRITRKGGGYLQEEICYCNFSKFIYNQDSMTIDLVIKLSEFSSYNFSKNSLFFLLWFL